MQPPAGLPHNRPRLVHWLVTVVGLAAVLIGAALIGPGDETATASARPVAAADVFGAPYPLDCGNTGVQVVRWAAADFDGDERAEAVAVVRCRSGAGTAPSGVYVLKTREQPKDSDVYAGPRVVATLVDPAQRMSVTGFAVRNGIISATLLGYSSMKVPRCCPDLRRAVEWRWKNGKFALTALPVAGSV